MHNEARYWIGALAIVLATIFAIIVSCQIYNYSYYELLSSSGYDEVRQSDGFVVWQKPNKNIEE